MATTDATAPTPSAPADPPPRNSLVLPLPPRRAVLPWLVVAALVACTYYFRGVFALLVTAFALAYVLEPLVSILQRYRVPRALAIVLVLLGAGLTLTALLAVVIPNIVHEVTTLTASLPRRVREEWLPYVMTHWLPYLRRRFHVRLPTTTDAWLAQVGLHASELVPRSLAALVSATSATVTVLELALEGLIVLALAFYLLMDYHGLVAGAEAMVPHRIRPRVVAVAEKIDKTMGHYIRGQVLVMCILGTLFATGLSALGVPAGLGIGIFAGLISFIPYLGFFIALAIALLLAVLDGGGAGHVLAVLGVMAFIHVLDVTVLTPRILGGSIGLSPVVVILALLAGAKAMGFVGLLIAIPVAAMARVVLVELVGLYKRSRFYLTQPDEPAPAPAPAPAPTNTSPPESS